MTVNWAGIASFLGCTEDQVRELKLGDGEGPRSLDALLDHIRGLPVGTVMRAEDLTDHPWGVVMDDVHAACLQLLGDGALEVVYRVKDSRSAWTDLPDLPGDELEVAYRRRESWHVIDPDVLDAIFPTEAPPPTILDFIVIPGARWRASSEAEIELDQAESEALLAAITGPFEPSPELVEIFRPKERSN